MTYITWPIELTPEEILADLYSFIKTLSPNWRENDANLDTWILQAMALEGSDLRTAATDTRDSIFRYFGQLVGIPPLEAIAATVPSTWTMIDSLGHTIPAGTFVTITDTLGNAVPFQTIVDITVPAGQTATAAGAVTLRAVYPGVDASGIGSIGGPVNLLDTLAFVSSIVQTAVTSGGQDAETASQYNDRLSSKLTLLTNRPVLPSDFALMAKDVTGVYRALAIDGYNVLHNLLTVDDSTLTSTVGGWVAGTNSTVVRSVAQGGAEGAAALQVTSVAAGDMTAQLSVASQVAVKPGETVTGVANSRSGSTGRATFVRLDWYTSGNVFISSTVGATVNDVVGNWTTFVSVTGVAPATAAFVRLVVGVNATGGAAENHYFDKMMIRRGSPSNTTWTIGGTAETSVERTISIAAVDSLGAAIASGVKTALDAYLQSNREVTFQVFVIDPTFTAIHVSYFVKGVVGFDPAVVAANATAALQSYLSSAVWGRDPAFTDTGSAQTWVDTPIVRYNEVLQVVANAEGVDYVTDLLIGLSVGTLARVDINLAAPASLTTAGTITSTVT